MQFEKDIFISYAHIDDESMVEGERGWIAEFSRSLEIRLAQLMGSKPKVWRDPKLQGNDFFGDEIVAQFPNVALLVSVLTPRYVNSKWCVKEVEGFTEAAMLNLGLRIQNKARLFKVIKTPVPREQHPDQMRDLLGYDFFRIDTDTGRAKEFGKIYGPEAEQAFWAKLDDLAHDIADLLTAMYLPQPAQSAAQTNTVAATVATTSSQPNKICVYLAEVSYDLRDERDSVRRELEESGYHVLPDNHLSMIAPELQEQVGEMLKRSEMAIHLIGANYGVVPDGSQKSIVELQNQYAAAHSSATQFKRIIWVSPENEVTDERQQTFVDSLRLDSGLQAGADLFEASLEEVKFAIEDHFRKPEKVEAPAGASEDEDTGPSIIYLICDQKDQEAIHELEDYLFDQGYDVVLPVFEGEEADLRIDHQENLKSCDAALIYYGEGNELWMRSKTRELMKIAGYGRSQPLIAKAVYLAGPANPRKERFRTHDSIVINGINGLDEDAIQLFTSKLKSSGDV